MKITYAVNIDVIVRYDYMFEFRINDCPVNKVRNATEEQMWQHAFKVADIMDANTGEVIMTIEKEY